MVLIPLLLIFVLIFIITNIHTGEVSSVEAKGDLFQHPRGIAIYHKDQSLFVACGKTVMKVTPSGCIDFSPFKISRPHSFLSLSPLFILSLLSFSLFLSLSFLSFSLFLSLRSLLSLSHSSFILFHFIVILFDCNFIIEGMSSIFAGSKNESGNRDGAGVNARFNCAYDIAIDRQTGSLFVSDNWNHNIRKITPQGKLFSFSPLF
jgi:hypothetical protein